MGDEPGITRDRLYGDIEWADAGLRVVDTGGIVPDDKALIPSEIFRQARVALEEADAIVMVVDGRTELASPDMELARLLLRTGKPLLLAVNKVDTPQAGALRRRVSQPGHQGAVSHFRGERQRHGRAAGARDLRSCRKLPAATEAELPVAPKTISHLAETGEKPTRLNPKVTKTPSDEPRARAEAKSRSPSSGVRTSASQRC